MFGRRNMDKVRIILKDGREIPLELYAESAPETVRNFLSLVDNGFYNGLCFHRVIDGFMIQGGGFTAEKDGSIKEKGGLKPIKGEFAYNGVNNPVKHTEGVISMARTQVMNSATSQFFICVADCRGLDGQYAAFGRITDENGLETAKSIAKVKTKRWGWYDDIPVEPVVIDKIVRD